MKTILLLLIGSFIAGTTAPWASAAETNAPALVMYQQPSWPVPGSTNYGPQIIVALWKDGRIVHSGSPLHGGPPLSEGKFKPEKLELLLNTLERRGAFKDEALQGAHFGPDAAFTTILINDGSRHLKMQSWHELYEENTNLVATARGVTTLNGQKREEVLQRQPEEYRRFRNTWSEIRQVVAGVIPQASEPYHGPAIPVR